ncbi:MAG: hypothetical protein KDF60_20345, partial [Calditrichaeota bacterium]|nr:hypothetical protein [Calditrichota bacterium]
MIKIPGNLDRAAQTCGNINCHPGITERVENSIMNTMSGVVSVNRYTFNESDSLNALNNIDQINHSAADTHLRNLCASCHTGKIKQEYGPIGELSRGGGCNACHLNYDSNALQQLELLKTNDGDSLEIKYHPFLSIKVTDLHCFGCHSRSGRISTNYQGWHETTIAAEKMPQDTLHRRLEDDRVFEFISEDIHHKRGMECIDCHNSYELMGDGTRYAHQEEQVWIQCEDCHRAEYNNTVQFSKLDLESTKITNLRGFEDTSRVFLRTQNGAIPLINTILVNNNEAVLTGKNSGKKFQLNPPAEICTRGSAHDRLTCNSCHSAWAPQCIGCHTEFVPTETGIDHLTGVETDGKWVEFVGEYLAEAPTLGVIGIKNKFKSEIKANSQEPKANSQEKIDTFIPGMVLTIDKSKFSGVEGDSVFKRLFAPTVAHTTSLKGRSCKSCHNNPVAIGYGRGKLHFEITGNKGEWKFNPVYQKMQDGLPADAWIGFLDSTKGGAS